MVSVGDLIIDAYGNKGIVYKVHKEWVHFIDDSNIHRSCTYSYIKEVVKQ